MSQFYMPFFSQFEKEFTDLLFVKDGTINTAKRAIAFTEEKLDELNTWLKNHEFPSNEEEIYFFKCLKPKLISKLIYYKAILNVESEAPIGKKHARKYYEKTLNRISQNSKENKAFYNYYRSGAIHKDEDYFVRTNLKPKINDDCFAMYYDISLCTKKHYHVAKMMANDLLVEYYENKIEEINNNLKSVQELTKSTLNWTGNKIDLIELVYALHQQKVFNGGNTDIKEISTYVGKMFNVEIEENIYRSYLDIKSRKSGHTKFLNSLSESLSKKIVSEDL